MRRFDPAEDARAVLASLPITPPLQEASGAPDPARQSPAVRPPRRHWFLRAVIIALAIALATLVRAWLGVRFGVTPPYLTYFPTILIVASVFGVARGIWTTLLSALCVDYFFLRGPGLAITNTGDRVAIAFFVLAGIAVSIVAGALRGRTWRMHQALEELRTSQQRTAQEQRHLYEATTRLNTIVDAADEAIIGKDVHGIVTSWNKGAETIFGYTAQEIIGRPTYLLLPPGHENEEDEIIERILRNEKVKRTDATRVAKDGRTVHLHLSVSPIHDAAGNVVGASKVAHDITETLKLQKQLQQSQKMEAIGQLTGGIAHDFNNLLAIVLGALELQHQSIAGNPDALHSWEVANRAAMRGAGLTRRLLAFSSMEPFKLAPTCLDQSIRSTMEMATRMLGPEIKVALKLDDSIPMVLVDPAGLESAVLNLIVNARDAMMPKGGMLTVSTRTCELDASVARTLTGAIQPGTYACISITDTGAGMSSEVLDRACEPFFTTKARGRGTGLGLSMVYGFVKHSSGGIRIYSEPGYGTTIIVYLPFDSSGAPVAKVRPAETVVADRSGLVLIADDEAELLEISVSYLKARGYTVLSASNAAEALSVLDAHGPVDAMVTDILMGDGMDGMELAQAVHRISPRTRVVYSSGFPADALSGRSLALADSLVLQKPYRLADLGASVDQALGVGIGRALEPCQPPAPQIVESQ